mgnify:CR=1 FL=1
MYVLEAPFECFYFYFKALLRSKMLLTTVIPLPLFDIYPGFTIHRFFGPFFDVFLASSLFLNSLTKATYYLSLNPYLM